MHIPAKLRVLGGLAVVAVVPAVALAAKPVPGKHYAQKKGGLFVFQFDVSKDGKKVMNLQANSKCSPVPFNPPLSARIGRTGQFSVSGNHKTFNNKTFKVAIAGKFVSKNEAKGTWRITGNGCTQKTAAFDAKRLTSGGG